MQTTNANLMLRNLVLFLMLSLSVNPWAGAGLLPNPGDWKAPGFSLPDLGGRQHALDDYRGKVVLVNFWATWCAPCLIEMPGMQHLLSDMQDRPFAILAVNVREPRATVWRFKNLLKVRFPTLLDSDGSVTGSWEVEYYPTTFLLDHEGNIRYTAYGAIDWDSDAPRRLIESLMPDGTAAINEAEAR